MLSESAPASGVTPSIKAIIDAVIADYPDEFASLHSGHAPSLAFLLAQVMRASDDKANAQVVVRSLRQRAEA